MRFEWDQAKAATNVAERGVTSDEATTAFAGPYARVPDDPDHSFGEERFIILGLSMRARELVVSHCIRGDGGEAIRIISARRATRRESAQYWRYVNAQ